MYVQFWPHHAIISRLFVMGGTRAQLTTCQVSLSGHTPHSRPVQTPPRAASLLNRAVESIVSTFRKRVATGLQTGRSFKIPDQKDQASDTTDFELVTWLVIKKP